MGRRAPKVDPPVVGALPPLPQSVLRGEPHAMLGAKMDALGLHSLDHSRPMLYRHAIARQPMSGCVDGKSELRGHRVRTRPEPDNIAETLKPYYVDCFHAKSD
jgi:hypothetical protein